MSNIDFPRAGPPPGGRPIGAPIMSAPPAKDYFLRVLIRSSEMGLVIGNKGSNARGLRDRMPRGSRLDIHELPRDDPIPYRCVSFTVSSDVDERAGGVAKNVQDLFELLTRDLEPEARCYLRFLVFHDQASALIGKGGNKIKSIRKESGAVIGCFKPPERECDGIPMGPEEEVVVVEGKKKEVIRAMPLIVDVFRTSHPSKAIMPVAGFDQRATDFVRRNLPSGGFATGPGGPPQGGSSRHVDRGQPSASGGPGGSYDKGYLDSGSRRGPDSRDNRGPPAPTPMSGYGQGQIEPVQQHQPMPAQPMPQQMTVHPSLGPAAAYIDPTTGATVWTAPVTIPVAAPPQPLQPWETEPVNIVFRLAVPSDKANWVPPLIQGITGVTGCQMAVSTPSDPACPDRIVTVWAAEDPQEAHKGPAKSVEGILRLYSQILANESQAVARILLHESDARSLLGASRSPCVMLEGITRKSGAAYALDLERSPAQEAREVLLAFRGTPKEVEAAVRDFGYMFRDTAVDSTLKTRAAQHAPPAPAAAAQAAGFTAGNPYASASSTTAVPVAVAPAPAAPQPSNVPGLVPQQAVPMAQMMPAVPHGATYAPYGVAVAPGGAAPMQGLVLQQGGYLTHAPMAQGQIAVMGMHPQHQPAPQQQMGQGGPGPGQYGAPSQDPRYGGERQDDGARGRARSPPRDSRDDRYRGAAGSTGRRSRSRSPARRSDPRERPYDPRGGRDDPRDREPRDRYAARTGVDPRDTDSRPRASVDPRARDRGPAPATERERPRGPLPGRGGPPGDRRY